MTNSSELSSTTAAELKPRHVVPLHALRQASPCTTGIAFPSAGPEPYAPAVDAATAASHYPARPVSKGAVDKLSSLDALSFPALKAATADVGSGNIDKGRFPAGSATLASQQQQEQEEQHLCSTSLPKGLPTTRDFLCKSQASPAPHSTSCPLQTVLSAEVASQPPLPRCQTKPLAYQPPILSALATSLSAEVESPRSPMSLPSSVYQDMQPFGEAPSHTVPLGSPAPVSRQLPALSASPTGRAGSPFHAVALTRWTPGAEQSNALQEGTSTWTLRSFKKGSPEGCSPTRASDSSVSLMNISSPSSGVHAQRTASSPTSYSQLSKEGLEPKGGAGVPPSTLSIFLSQKKRVSFVDLDSMELDEGDGAVHSPFESKAAQEQSMSSTTQGGRGGREPPEASPDPPRGWMGFMVPASPKPMRPDTTDGAPAPDLPLKTAGACDPAPLVLQNHKPESAAADNPFAVADEAGQFLMSMFRDLLHHSKRLPEAILTGLGMHPNENDNSSSSSSSSDASVTNVAPPAYLDSGSTPSAPRTLTKGILMTVNPDVNGTQQGSEDLNGSLYAQPTMIDFPTSNAKDDGLLDTLLQAAPSTSCPRSQSQIVAHSDFCFSPGEAARSYVSAANLPRKSAAVSSVVPSMPKPKNGAVGGGGDRLSHTRDGSGAGGGDWLSQYRVGAASSRISSMRGRYHSETNVAGHPPTEPLDLATDDRLLLMTKHGQLSRGRSRRQTVTDVHTADMPTPQATPLTSSGAPDKSRGDVVTKSKLSGSPDGASRHRVASTGPNPEASGDNANLRLTSKVLAGGAIITPISAELAKGSSASRAGGPVTTASLASELRQMVRDEQAGVQALSTAKERAAAVDSLERVRSCLKLVVRPGSGKGAEVGYVSWPNVKAVLEAEISSGLMRASRDGSEHLRVVGVLAKIQKIVERELSAGLEADVASTGKGSKQGKSREGKGREGKSRGASKAELKDRPSV